ncbi:MAG: hypothetical protein QME50_06655 [Candidatus Bathyarchaeota archaeon]|nr:hypothetical protein [Candidatus Bathyarchaeota archaeon]MDI6805885.1 hypothetical protein [Candidatus Bathyarchaeia archaeon]
MLGFYENFPQNIHKTAHFTISVSNKRLQQTLIRILQQINAKPFKLEEIADPSIPQCTVLFEFGIAEANTFNFLSNEETNKVLKAINKKPFQLTDFFCAIRYYKTENEQKKPLKFDYYMIRFIFNKNYVETQVFHERGPRYISPDDVVNLVSNKINEAFSRKILKPLQPS